MAKHFWNKTQVLVPNPSQNQNPNPILTNNLRKSKEKVKFPRKKRNQVPRLEFLWRKLQLLRIIWRNKIHRKKELRKKKTILEVVLFPLRQKLKLKMLRKLQVGLKNKETRKKLAKLIIQLFTSITIADCVQNILDGPLHKLELLSNFYGGRDWSAKREKAHKEFLEPQNQSQVVSCTERWNKMQATFCRTLFRCGKDCLLNLKCIGNVSEEEETLSTENFQERLSPNWERPWKLELRTMVPMWKSDPIKHSAGWTQS